MNVLFNSETKTLFGKVFFMDSKQANYVEIGLVKARNDHGKVPFQNLFDENLERHDIRFVRHLDHRCCVARPVTHAVAR